MVTCNSEIDLPDAVNVVSSANILADEYCKLSFLYVCMVNTIYLLCFVETPRK